MALLKVPDFDVSVAATNWGQTGFIHDDSAILDRIKSLMVKHEIEKREGRTDYDLSVQVTIPNEFQKLARVNIGITAGIEVDCVSPEWVLKCNSEIDYLVVPSEHSKKSFENATFIAQHDNSVLQLNKPVYVAAEGVDTSIFNPTNAHVWNQRFDTEFNFLCVGLGLDRGMGEDRKNISGLVKSFLEAFAGDKTVGLVLKISMVNGSLMDFEATKRRLGEIRSLVGCGEYPAIHLIHGRLSDKEMSDLYTHPQIKAYVTPTHGEGFGLPILEAAACGLPVIATGWSGHLDFLTMDGKKKFVPIKFTMKDIPQSAVWKGVMEQGTKWADPDMDELKNLMRKFRINPDPPKSWALDLTKRIQSEFSLDVVTSNLAKMLVDFSSAASSVRPKSKEEFVSGLRASLFSSEELSRKKLIYTMPMSAGDVFVSTAVVDSLKKKFADHDIYFATSQKYYDILDENADIHRVIEWQPWMQDVDLLEKLFDEVYTPNLNIQMVYSNWVHKGKGRKLAQEMAVHCNVELGDYKIKSKDAGGFPESYIAFHPGSGQGQWEARNYLSWQEIVENLTRQGFAVVQVGTIDEPLYKGAIDNRGKTPSYGMLYDVISRARCVLGIDSVSMHMAAAAGVPHVALFGSSYAGSTGPALPKYASQKLSILMETPSRHTCDKACYKYQCSVDKDNPCINEIDPKTVFDNVTTVIQMAESKIPGTTMLRTLRDDEIIRYEYKEHNPKISGYTHVLNPSEQGFPYEQSIRSMLGFCDEVVVVEGGSTDGSKERLEQMAKEDPRIKVVSRVWDWEEPGMDGMQKAFGRAMCSGEFLWQQDADEVVHERDYVKIRNLAKKFPKDAKLISLPVVELWGDGETVRTDRHSWKWRFSRNDFVITHGIVKHARVYDQKTGKLFAKKNMSDGCEYIDIMTGEYIPHKNFYTQELEQLRLQNPEEYGKKMNQLFNELPSVFHYSWANIYRKIGNFIDFWDRSWQNLYNETSREPRFPGISTDEQIAEKAEQMKAQGGEHGKAPTFKLVGGNPEIMKSWLTEK